MFKSSNVTVFVSLESNPPLCQSIADNVEQLLFDESVVPNKFSSQHDISMKNTCIQSCLFAAMAGP